MMKLGKRTRHVAGVTLVEMAATLAVLGAATAAVLPLWLSQTSADEEARILVSMDRARGALTAYATLNGRLPCPATDAASGTEAVDCKGKPSGFLPYVTLGLPDGGFAGLPYSISVDGAADAKPAAQIQVLVAKADEIATGKPLDLHRVALRNGLPSFALASQARQVLDYCQLLEAAGAPAALARVQAAPATGSRTDALITVGELWSAMQCSAQISADARDRYTLPLVAATHWRTLLDDQVTVRLHDNLRALDQRHEIVTTALSVAATALAAVRTGQAVWHNTILGDTQPPELVAAQVVAGLTAGQLAVNLSKLAQTYLEPDPYTNDFKRMDGLSDWAQKDWEALMQRAKDSNDRGILLWLDVPA